MKKKLVKKCSFLIRPSSLLLFTGRADLKISAQKTSKTLAKIIENAKNRGKNKSTFNRRAVDVEVQPPCYFEDIFLEKGFLIVAIFRLILLECC